MTTNFTTPQYPVISWQTYWTDGAANQLELGCNGNFLMFDIDDAAWQGLWGFASDGSNEATSTSLHGYLATLIQDFLRVDCGFGLAECTATYVWDLPGWPRVRFDIANTAGNDLTIEFFDDVLAYHFGVDGAKTVTVDALTGGLLDFNSAGYWAPNALTLYDDRIYINPSVYTSKSLSGVTFKTVTWADTECKRSLTFPFVKPAFLYLYRREDAGFAPAASLDTSDPNNLMENLLEAARLNNTNQDSTPFRIYNQAGVYRGARLVDELIKDPSQVVNDNAGGSGLRFKVVLMFRDVGTEGSGI